MSSLRSFWRPLLATGAVGPILFVCTSCGADPSVVDPSVADLSVASTGDVASVGETAAHPKELDQRGTVIIRVPFDERGQAQEGKAELRVLRQSGQQGTIEDFNTAEQAWQQAKAPARLVQEGVQEGIQEDVEARQESGQEHQLVESSHTEMQPPGYYTWNRGYPPAYYNRGFRWGYGLPGFYFGWNTGRGGFSFGYGPGYNYGYGPGFGYAGGYGGWYGYPIGYGAPYPGWYRPGYGYYFYPRHLGGWRRP